VGYKYRNLALQVGGVSNERVSYGLLVLRDLDLRVTALARPRAIVRVNYRYILSSERVLNIRNPTIVRQKNDLVKSSRWEPDTKTGRNLTST
jgi:hypothetical protein